MHRSILDIAAAVAFLFAPAAQAGVSPPVSFPKTSKWVVNYEPDACHLAAQFGSGSSTIIARFTQYQPGATFDLSLIGPPVQIYGFTAPISIDFGQNAKPDRTDALVGTLGTQPLLIFGSTRLDGWRWQKRGDVAPADPVPAQEFRVNSLTLDLTTRRHFRIELGPMDKPMDALRTCMDNLLRHWGYDPEVQRSLTRPVTPENYPGDWLTTGDFPSRSLAAGHNGMVQFRLDVAEDGKVASCQVLARTNPDEFADTTCRLIVQRARLLPALDSGSKPVRSYYVQKVRWLSPG